MHPSVYTQEDPESHLAPFAGSAEGSSKSPPPTAEIGKLSDPVRGRLQCLLRSGHLETGIRQVDGLLASGEYAHQPNALGELHTFGVAAAWRLGRWDHVDELLAKTTCAQCNCCSSSFVLGSLWARGGNLLCVFELL